MGVSRRDLIFFWRGSDPPPSDERDSSPPREPSVPPLARTPSVPPLARAPSVPPPLRAPSVPPPAPRVGLTPLRPPGALGEADFLATCARCGLCVEACPVDAIHPIAEGLAAGTPAIEARTAPCILCEELACTHACPSGALGRITDRLAIRMGTATLDPAWCIATRGAPCRACVDVCPVPGALKLVHGPVVYIPEVDAERCVGCGICEHRCPTRPAAIVVVPRGVVPDKR